MGEKLKIIAQYRDLLAGQKGIELPYVPDYVDRHSWYMFAIQVDEDIRDDAVKQLAGNQIQTRLSFPPIHIQQYYRERFGYQPEDLPASYHTWRRLINLPIWPGLSTDQVDHVVGQTIKAVGS